MKILMDADCLIKVTKSGLKELVVSHFQVLIPVVVEKEVVTEGKKKNCADAVIVESNISKKAISVLKQVPKFKSGDEALEGSFDRGKFDAIATDDTKLIRRLKASNVPFLVPGLILYRLAESGVLDLKEAFSALDRLGEFISEEEATTVRILMEALQ